MSFTHKQLRTESVAFISDKKNLFIEKSTISGNAINVFRNNPFEDIGTYIYKEDVKNRDMDFDSLEKLIKKS